MARSHPRAFFVPFNGREEERFLLDAAVLVAGSGERLAKVPLFPEAILVETHSVLALGETSFTASVLTSRVELASTVIERRGVFALADGKGEEPLVFAGIVR